MLSKSRESHFSLVQRPRLFFNFERLIPCYLFKMTEAPTQYAFRDIQQLEGKNAVILYRGEIYYANQRKLYIHKIKKTFDNREQYNSLIEEFTENRRLADNNALIEKIKSVTGYSQQNPEDAPLPHNEFLEIIHDLFQTPFGSFYEFILQCVDSFNITMVLLPAYICFISFAITAMLLVTPFLVFYNLCFNSSDEAIDDITHLLDMFVGLGDFIIKLALSIPIQLCSIIARGILSLLPMTFVTESKNTEVTSNIINLMSQSEETLTYYDAVIAPMLIADDNTYIRSALEHQLNLGFHEKMLKKALSWAGNRHTSMPNLIVPEDYNVFFHRIADICYVSLTDNYWLSYERHHVSPEDQPSIPSTHVNDRPTNHSAVFSFWGTPFTCNVITYFDEVVSKKLQEESDKATFKSGLKRLVTLGFSSDDLRSALEWAVDRHDNNNLINPNHSENHMIFCERVADICGVIFAGKLLAGKIASPPLKEAEGQFVMTY